MRSSRPTKILATLIGAAMLLVPATPALADADISVGKTAPASVVAGASLTYEITVTNGGPDVADVTLTDVIPAGTTFVSVTPASGWSCSAPAVGGTGTVTCSNATAAVGAHGPFTLVVKVDLGAADGTVITNTATVSTTTVPDPDPTDDSATATTTVGLVSELCTITGTNGPDLLTGTAGDDVICGGNGADTIDGAGGNDVIAGGNGKDVLVGGEGDDLIFGRNGKDQITGGLGLDTLVGGNGKDMLDGQDGAGGDSLDGGRGMDDCRVDPAPAVDTTANCP